MGNRWSTFPARSNARCLQALFGRAFHPGGRRSARELLLKRLGQTAVRPNQRRGSDQMKGPSTFIVRQRQNVEKSRSCSVFCANNRRIVFPPREESYTRLTSMGFTSSLTSANGCCTSGGPIADNADYGSDDLPLNFHPAAIRASVNLPPARARLAEVAAGNVGSAGVIDRLIEIARIELTESVGLSNQLRIPMSNRFGLSGPLSPYGCYSGPERKFARNFKEWWIYGSKTN